MNQNGSTGWYPGQGSSFTPYRDAKWTEEFNRLLPKYKSRNELTTILIEKGLECIQFEEKETIRFDLNVKDLTEEQKELLKSPAAEALVKNIVLTMLGKNTSSLSFITDTSLNETQEREQEINSKNKPTTTNKPNVMERAMKAHRQTNMI